MDEIITSEANGFSIVEIKNNFFLFDIENLIFCTITKELKDKIEQKKYSAFSKAEYDMLKTLKEHNLFFYKCNTEFPEAYQMDSINFSLAPVHNCNFACKYCFASGGNNFIGQSRSFSEELIKQIGDFLINSFPNINQYRLDFVSGGEPLLNKELFKFIVDYFLNIFEKNGKKLFIWVCTNASLLDNEILSFLDTRNIKIGISLDGPKEVNDQNRVFKHNGNGTYDTVIQSIQNIRNSTEYSRNIKDLWGLSVVSANNMDLISILNHHKEIGFSSIQMKIVRLNKECDLSINESNIDTLINNVDQLLEYSINKYIEENDISYLLFFLNNNDYIGKFICTLLTKKPHVYRCGAGRFKFAFAADGSIYPCDSFVGKKQFCIGNVKSGLINNRDNVFYNKTVADRPFCKDCWARFVCAGDCFHNSFEASGDIAVPDKCFCKFTKSIVKLCIYYLNKLYEASEDKFKELQHIVIVRDNLKK